MNRETNISHEAKAFESGIWYTISNFLIRGIGFITTPIFTRILSKTDFGLYNNFSSWLSIITIFITLNLESTLISARFDHEKDFDGYILSCIALSSISTCFWFAVINVFSESFVSLFGLNLKYINAMLLYLLFLPAVNLFMARERYYFEYKWSVATSLFISLGTAILSVLLVYTLNNKLLGRIIGSIVPTIILGVCFIIFFIVRGKCVRASYWKYALPICLPFIPHLLSMNLLNSVDRVMITRWWGAEYTAVYSLAYTCGSIVTLLLTSMNSAFAPWLGEKLHHGQYSVIRAFSKKYILGFCVLAIGIMLLCPEVLYFLGGTDYIEAKYVMTPIAMGCVCQFLYTLFVNIEQFKRKTVSMAIASAIAAIVNYILNFIFIPTLGYLTAAYTTLAGYLVLLGIHMYLVHRLQLDSVYDYKFVVTTIVIMLILMVIITLTYSINIIRYIIISIYFLVSFIFAMKNKKRIVSFINKRS